MENSKNELYIIAMVAIVAVVSLVVIVMNSAGNKQDYVPSDALPASMVPPSDNVGGVIWISNVYAVGDTANGGSMACCCAWMQNSKTPSGICTYPLYTPGCCVQN